MSEPIALTMPYSQMPDRYLWRVVLESSGCTPVDYLVRSSSAERAVTKAVIKYTPNTPTSYITRIDCQLVESDVVEIGHVYSE